MTGLDPGVDAHDVARLLQRRPTLDFGLSNEGETELSRPSKQADGDRDRHRER